MLLAIDIGNTNTAFGVFDSEKLITHFKVPTLRDKNHGEIIYSIREKISSPVSAIIISSVVPELNDAFQKLSEKFYRLKPIFVDHNFDFNLKIKYNPPSSIGSDRLVAAFAAIAKYGKSCIVCDFGTATTIDAVNSNSEYLGGIIAPGMNVLANALYQTTSKLPKVAIKKPESVFGNSTIHSIQSGTYFGYIGLVDGIIQRMIDELREKPKVIATGGLVYLIAESSNSTG
jgi:type III pantothenate kinase